MPVPTTWTPTSTQPTKKSEGFGTFPDFDLLGRSMTVFPDPTTATQACPLPPSLHATSSLCSAVTTRHCPPIMLILDSGVSADLVCEISRYYPMRRHLLGYLSILMAATSVWCRRLVVFSTCIRSFIVWNTKLGPHASTIDLPRPCKLRLPTSAS